MVDFQDVVVHPGPPWKQPGVSCRMKMECVCGSRVEMLPRDPYGFQFVCQLTRITVMECGRVSAGDIPEVLSRKD